MKVRKEGWKGSLVSPAAGRVVWGTTYGTEVNAQEILEQPVSVKPIFCLYPL